MRRLLVGLLGLVGAVVLAAAGLLGFVLTRDPDDYRDDIADAAERATGRRVAIEGRLSWELSLSPTLVAERLAFANAPWGSRPAMLLVRRAEMRLDLLALLDGRLAVERLQLAGLDLLLETDAGGRGNWQVGRAGGAATEAASPAPVFPDLRELAVTEARIAWRDGASGTGFALELPVLAVRAAAHEAPFELSGTARWEGREIALVGRAGALSALHGAAYPIALSAKSGDLSLELDGKLTDPLGRPGVDLQASFAGKRLDALPFDRGDLRGELPFAVSARVSGDAGKLVLEPLHGSLGPATVDGTLGVVAADGRPKLQGGLRFGTLDLPALLLAAPPPPPGRLLPDRPFRLEALRPADADLELTAERLALPGLALSQLKARAVLSAGVLRLEPVEVALADGQVAGSATLDAREALPRLAAKADFRRLDVARLLAGTPGAGLLEGRADGAVELASRGASPAALAAAADGSFRLLLADGRVRARGYEALVGGLGTVFGTLTASGEDWTRLNCAAMHWPVRAGIAEARVLAVDTTHATLRGEGRIDLRQERLDLLLTPGAKQVTLNVAVPVRVRGTLAAPEVRPDELGTVRKLGSLVGATLFPPALLLGFGDLGGSAGAACRHAVGTTAPAPARTPVEQAGEAVRGVGEGVGKALGDIGRGLGNLFGR